MAPRGRNAGEIDILPYMDFLDLLWDKAFTGLPSPICFKNLIGRVAPGCYQLRAPTDPDMRDSRIRLLKSWFRNATSTLMDNTRLRQREPLKQLVEPLPGPMGFT